MKKRARETEETPQQIISNAVAHLNEHAAVTMPPVHHIRRDIRRQRKMAGNPIPVPQDRFFDIPPIYQETTAGQPLMFSALCHPKTAFLKATKWPKFAITMHYLCTYLYFVKFVLVYIVTLSP